METLIRKFGGDPFVAPSMQEIPVQSNEQALRLAEDLGDPASAAVLVFLTGVGATALLDAMASTHDREAVLEQIRSRDICVRGPKPAAVMKTWGVDITVKAPEPNTWVELIQAIDDSKLAISGREVVVQEYGQASVDLHAALAERGAIVRPVTVYRWAMPDDTSLLEQAVSEISTQSFDVVLITSAQQIRHAIEIAEKLEVASSFADGIRKAKLASIGPTATAALNDLGFQVDVEPEHPKMGPLVRAALA